MTTQPEALRLAHWIESESKDPRVRDAADELRQLHEANQELLGVLHTITSLAVGEGDVCEIIAKRARAAIAKAERTTP